MAIDASVYIATSLDGFIARDGGDIDWLLKASDSEDDYGYAAFMASVDTLVMGRKTFQTVLSFGEWPYAGKRVVVLSRTLTRAEIPEQLSAAVEVHAGPVEALVSDLGKTGAKRLYVDGGQAIQSFLKAGRLNRLTVTRVPVLIGSGVPLFGELPEDIQLVHQSTSVFQNGFVQSTYRVKRR